MNLLDWINQGITNLVNTSSPSIDALGFRMFVALLTTMMVWFGVQEALSSAEGRSGFSVAKFVASARGVTIDTYPARPSRSAFLPSLSTVQPAQVARWEQVRAP
jgi:hypothetical protein